MFTSICGCLRIFCNHYIRYTYIVYYSLIYTYTIRMLLHLYLYTYTMYTCIPLYVYLYTTHLYITVHLYIYTYTYRPSPLAAGKERDKHHEPARHVRL